MTNLNKVVRKNIRMSPEVADWYEKRAKELGVSQSNLMVMALSEYIKQDKTIKMMSNIENMLKQLERMESNSQNE
jgi:hypothetical protein